MRQQEYVLTAPDSVLLGVVRPLHDRRGVVPWWATGGLGWSSVEHVGTPEGVLKMGHCSVVIGQPDRGAGVVLATRGVSSWGPPYVQVWAGPGQLLGVARRLHPTYRQTLGVRACCCGKSPHACVCGIPEGRLVRTGPKRSSRSWTIVDGRDVEVAEVTAHPLSDPNVPRLRAWAEQGLVRGAIRAARSALLFGPIACAVTDAPPDFSWEESGLVVAVAALCDARVLQRSLPTGGG